MCCIMPRVEYVADTCIFARFVEKGEQVLVYSMKMGATDDVAMILPIPVARNSGEKAVTFISLEKYPDFFKDMRKGFRQLLRGKGGGGGFGAPPPNPKRNQSGPSILSIRWPSAFRLSIEVGCTFRPSIFTMERYTTKKNSIIRFSAKSRREITAVSPTVLNQNNSPVRSWMSRSARESSMPTSMSIAS